MLRNMPPGKRNGGLVSDETSGIFLTYPDYIVSSEYIGEELNFRNSFFLSYIRRSLLLDIQLLISVVIITSATIG